MNIEFSCIDQVLLEIFEKYSLAMSFDSITFLDSKLECWKNRWEKELNEGSIYIRIRCRGLDWYDLTAMDR